MKAAPMSSARPFPDGTPSGLHIFSRPPVRGRIHATGPRDEKEKGVDLPGRERSLGAFRMTTTTETKPETKSRSLSPDEIPFHNTQSFGRYTTDTGKLLPRKYTRMSAKQQRRVTKTIKRARNLHLMA